MKAQGKHKEKTDPDDQRPKPQPRATHKGKAIPPCGRLLVCVIGLPRSARGDGSECESSQNTLSVDRAEGAQTAGMGCHPAALMGRANCRFACAF